MINLSLIKSNIEGESDGDVGGIYSDWYDITFHQDEVTILTSLHSPQSLHHYLLFTNISNED